MTKPFFSNVKLTPDKSGFTATVNDALDGKPLVYKMTASFNLFIIREAWERGLDLEALADGFGGMGTMGDWSAIRDSTDPAKERMLEEAINFIFPHRDVARTFGGVLA